MVSAYAASPAGSVANPTADAPDASPRPPPPPRPAPGQDTTAADATGPPTPPAAHSNTGLASDAGSTDAPRPVRRPRHSRPMRLITRPVRNARRRGVSGLGDWRRTEPQLRSRCGAGHADADLERRSARGLGPGNRLVEVASSQRIAVLVWEHKPRLAVAGELIKLAMDEHRPPIKIKIFDGSRQ
jgi:hypothetical protein